MSHSKTCPHCQENDKKVNEVLTNKPLSAEEVLENIFTLLNLPRTFDPKNGIPKASYDAVKAEVLDFAKQYAEEERGRADGNFKSYERIKDLYSKARNEAVEEAAKVAEIPLCKNDSHCQWICQDIATHIRALKTEGKI